MLADLVAGLTALDRGTRSGRIRGRVAAHDLAVRRARSPTWRPPSGPATPTPRSPCCAGPGEEVELIDPEDEDGGAGPVERAVRPGRVGGRRGGAARRRLRGRRDRPAANGRPPAAVRAPGRPPRGAGMDLAHRELAGGRGSDARVPRVVLRAGRSWSPPTTTRCGCSNGDVGVTVRTGAELRVAFGKQGGIIDFAPGRSPMCRRCTRLTVHRSQGSQFDHVTVVLPEEDSPLSTRVSCCTRADPRPGRVRLIGTEAELRAAVGRPAAGPVVCGCGWGRRTRPPEPGPDRAPVARRAAGTFGPGPAGRAGQAGGTARKAINDDRDP